MQSEPCPFCHRLVYIGYVDNNKFRFNDPALTLPHAKSSCVANQTNSVEFRLKTLEEKLGILSDNVKKIMEKMDLE